MSLKSDDIRGRSKTYESIVFKNPIPIPSTPESFNVLTRELQALGLEVTVNRNIPDNLPTVNFESLHPTLAEEIDVKHLAETVITASVNE